MSQKFPKSSLVSGLPPPQGLYDPSHETDSCGVGFIAQENGQPSHEILKQAIQALNKLSHRGAVDADEQTGDGAGVLTQIPKKFFKRELLSLKCQPIHLNDLAVAMVFFPRHDPEARERSFRIFEDCLLTYGLNFLGWRWVPINVQTLGAKAARLCPDIQQALVGRPDFISPDNFERTLFLARQEIVRRFQSAGIDSYHICSFSSRTIVYKGLLMAGQLPQFFGDLQDPLFETALTVFHQRYSTKRFPTRIKW